MTRSEMQTKIKGIICEFLEIDPRTADVSEGFDQIRANAVELAELGLTIERRLDVRLGEEVLNRLASLNMLYNEAARQLTFI